MWSASFELAASACSDAGAAPFRIGLSSSSAFGASPLRYDRFAVTTPCRCGVLHPWPLLRKDGYPADFA
jgi:hypothetical protein